MIKEWARDAVGQVREPLLLPGPSMRALSAVAWKPVSGPRLLGSSKCWGIRESRLDARK